MFGRRFDLRTDSTVKFDGAPDYPDLDVTAIDKTPTEKVTVLVTVKGIPGHAERSRPPRPTTPS